MDKQTMLKWLLFRQYNLATNQEKASLEWDPWSSVYGRKLSPRGCEFEFQR